MFRLLALTVPIIALLQAAPASAAFIVVPPALENSPGSTLNQLPFGNRNTQTGGYRTQLVYDASLFSAVSGPQLITAIQFRPDGANGFLAGGTLNISDVRLQLSTTNRSDENRNPLSSTFADNIGTDVTTVYTGPLTLTTNATLLPNGTRAFDYTINLQTGFVYDKSMGNLLLDTLVPVGSTSRGSGFAGIFNRFDSTDGVNDGIYSVANFSSGAATTGSVRSFGPVTRFQLTPVVTAVPVPPSITLVGSAAISLLLIGVWRRRTAQGNLIEAHTA